MSVTIVRQRDLDAKMKDPAFAKLVASSGSPSAVGGDLGITRHAVYDLIRRGRLDAIRLVSDRSPRRLLALLITDESVRRYRETRYQRTG